MEKIICIVIVVLYGVVCLIMGYLSIITNKPKNKVHFYVARDKDGSLWLYLGKPFKKIDRFSTRVDDCWIRLDHQGVFKYFGLNEHDYDNLKWADEPVEVFLNIKD